MSQLQTTRKVVLDFDQAVKQGMCRDHNLDKHLIRGHGDQFLITVCNGQEYCFDRHGIQVGVPSKKVKLVEPAKMEVSLLTYLIYDQSTMTIVGQGISATDGHFKAQSRKDDNIKCINVTHPLNQEVLKQLGITQRRWYEEA